jgi:hypothetical protein
VTVRTRVLPLVTVAVALIAAPRALADADPASDILISSDVFLSYQTTIASPEGRALLQLTDAAKRQGYPMKVAVIAQRPDLGAIPQLFRKPDKYARFLYAEDSYVFRGAHLLVVMPNGYGVARVSPAARRAVKGLPVPNSADATKLARAAADGVRAMAAAEGHRLPAVKVSGGGGSSAGPIYLAIGLSIATLAAAAATVLILRRSRRPRSAP